MNRMLQQRLDTHTVVTAADAAACGVGRHGLARMVRVGQLQRVHRGVYVAGTVWRDATPEGRHLLRCRAVIHTHEAVVLSHTSAVIAAGLPTYGVDVGTVHLSRVVQPGRRGRRGGICIHPMLPAEACSIIGGLPVCTPPVASLQVADLHGVESGMVAAEAGLHRGLFTCADLARARKLARLGRGRPAADFVVRFARPHSESPGETLTRLLLHSLAVPEPVQQACIDLLGGGHARVDFLLRAWAVVIEFDGAVKYGRANGRAELIREKHREDGIRATGREVVRLVWSDLSRPARVLELLHNARHRADAGRRSRT